MLNANDIANKKFDRAMGRGYKPEEVDRYLEQVAGDFDELIAEKRELEQKLLVLADKLEEYKHDEESLRSALLGAQKLGDSVVREAKAKAELMIEDANIKANMLVENAKHAIEKEQNAFIRMQREVATFRSKLQLMYKQHLELISSIPADEELIRPVAKSMLEPEQAEPVQTIFSIDSAQEGEPLAEEAFSPERTPDSTLEYSEDALEYTDDSASLSEARQSVKRESRFGPLKFGKEFDIKRDDDKRRR